jgi:adenosylcobinamide-GDP ribazoletransferase
MRLGSSLLADFCLCVGFFTRLPCPSWAQRSEPVALTNFPRAVRMVPLAGGAIGALAAITLAGGLSLGLPPVLAAPLAICSLVAAGGAMHEDGLADCADGFFGGATRSRKLEIMRDSRIGTFGTAALLLALYVRIASLTVIADQSQELAIAALVAAAAFSRTAGLLPLALLPPARGDGAGFAAGKPKSRALAAAACIAILFALAPVVAGASLARALAGIALGTAAAYAVVAFAKQQIGGQTGDVAGAAQQLSEIAFYLAFAAHI